MLIFLLTYQLNWQVPRHKYEIVGVRRADGNFCPKIVGFILRKHRKSIDEVCHYYCRKIRSCFVLATSQCNLQVTMCENEMDEIEEEIDNGVNLVSFIAVRASLVVDQITFGFKDGTMTKHGEERGTVRQAFLLRFGEHVARVHVWQNRESLNGIRFFTNKNRASEVYGSESGKFVVFDVALGSEGVAGVLRERGGTITAFKILHRNGTLTEEAFSTPIEEVKIIEKVI